MAESARQLPHVEGVLSAEELRINNEDRKMRSDDMSEELRDLETQLDAIEVQISACRETKKEILERIKKINSEDSRSKLRRENALLRVMVAALLRDKGHPYKEIAEQLGGVTTQRARQVALNGFRYLSGTMRAMEKSGEIDSASKEWSE